MKTKTQIRKEQEDLLDWYEGPLTKERVATLRQKLAKTRGLLYELFWIMRNNPKARIGFLSINKTELEQILKETNDI